MTLFVETCAKYGWHPVEELSDRLDFCGGLTMRKGHVRVELSSMYLVDRDYRVEWYTNTGISKGSLAAIMVDFGHRGVGLGHAALLDVLAITDELEWDELYLEACKITKRGTGKSEMGDLALSYWYRRHGFLPGPRYKREGGVDGDSTRVMIRKRPGANANG